MPRAEQWKILNPNKKRDCQRLFFSYTANFIKLWGVETFVQGTVVQGDMSLMRLLTEEYFTSEKLAQIKFLIPWTLSTKFLFLLKNGKLPNISELKIKLLRSVKNGNSDCVQIFFLTKQFSWSPLIPHKSNLTLFLTGEGVYIDPTDF